MSSLEREWALRLPNGQMLMDRMSEPEPEEMTPFSFMAMFGQRPQYLEPPKVRIFASQAAAQKVADWLRNEARKVGVDELLVVPVARWCSSWQTPDVGEQIASAFLDYIAGEPS